MFLEQLITERHMTLKTRVMMLKIQLCITGINYIIKYITIVIFNCKNIIFIVLLYFRSNKYTLGELDLPYLILLTPNVWDIQTKRGDFKG